MSDQGITTNILLPTCIVIRPPSLKSNVRVRVHYSLAFSREDVRSFFLWHNPRQEIMISFREYLNKLWHDASKS